MFAEKDVKTCSIFFFIRNANLQLKKKKNSYLPTEMTKTTNNTKCW